MRQVDNPVYQQGHRSQACLATPTSERQARPHDTGTEGPPKEAPLIGKDSEGLPSQVTVANRGGSRARCQPGYQAA